MTGRRATGPAAAAVAAPPIVRARRVAGAPVVAVRVWLVGGARVESTPGLAWVTGRLLGEGTLRRSWRELADRVEARGMVLHAAGTFESHGLGVDALAGDWEEALELAAEAAGEPAFPEDRCAWMARQTAAELESLADQPEVLTAWAFLEQLYHPHRRALPLQGTPDALAALTPADCAAFHERAAAAGLRVVVAGEIDAAAVEERARRLFAGASTAPAGEPLAEPPAPVGLGERRRVIPLPPPPDPEESGQAHLYLGHLTVGRRHPDYEALELAAVVLGAGAGLTGRIPERIREREGLAYAASAQTIAGAGLDPGRLVVYVGTGSATVERAEAAAREEVERFVDQGPTVAEVEEARSYLLGREPFLRETARQWADVLSEAEHYGLPLDDPAWRRERLARLERDGVAEAVRRHLRPGELRATVGVPTEEER
jgi:zinc protease